MAQPTASSGAPVVVACKHPPGIFMRIFKSQEFDVPVLGGGTRKEAKSFAVGSPIKINGPAVPFGQAPRCRIVNGYALTTDIPADVARTYMEQNKESDLVAHGLIDVFPDIATAEKECKGRKIKSGLEQLDVGTIRREGREVPRDPRWPARSNPNLSGVSTDKRDDA